MQPTTTVQPITTFEPTQDDRENGTESVTAPVAITRYGIPVRVSGATENGWEVFDPCGDLQTVSKIVPIESTEVVIDPGHGGKDSGAIGHGGLKESDVNLRVAIATSQLLKDKGVPTFLTRMSDYYISLDERIALADAAEAKALISIHHNAPASAASKTPGTEVFAQSGDSESARLSGLLHREVFEALMEVEGVRWTSRWDAGALRVLNSRGSDAYRLVRKPKTTNALIEVGYHASASEGAFMATDEYVQIVALALATAIETFITTNENGTPLNERARTYNPSGGRTICPTVELE